MKHLAATSLLAALPCVALGNESADSTQSKWSIAAGGGVLMLPEFPGSDSHEVLPLPAFNITYNERWFLNTDGLGAFLFRNAQWSLSTSINADLLHRDESDADYLRGTGDIDRTAIALLKGTYQLSFLTASLSLGTDIADQGHGTVAELALQAHSQLTPRLGLTYGLAGRWIDNEYAETFFGIARRQSLDSGLPLYVAESGVGDTRAFLNVAYALNPRWLISGGATLGQLQGDAADSPVVADDTFWLIRAALLYRF